MRLVPCVRTNNRPGIGRGLAFGGSDCSRFHSRRLAGRNTSRVGRDCRIIRSSQSTSTNSAVVCLRTPAHRALRFTGSSLALAPRRMGRYAQMTLSTLSHSVESESLTNGAKTGSFLWTDAEVDREAWFEIRRHAVLDGCKWDPQVGDIDTL